MHDSDPDQALFLIRMAILPPPNNRNSLKCVHNYQQSRYFYAVKCTAVLKTDK